MNETTEFDWKLFPFTVRVKAAPPGVTELGLRLVMELSPFDPVTWK